MKQMFGAFATAVTLVCLPAVALAQTGPAGNWELTMTTPQGTSTVTLALTVAGDKVSGDLSSQMGSVPVTGTATADSVQLSADLNIQGMALTFGIDGKVAGDSMSGNERQRQGRRLWRVPVHRYSCRGDCRRPCCCSRQ
jgi:hypothetical protein